jgi:cellulose synthase/poly-beta-1,6-N-acetylglucosamine synthase-like glycosyltransferase
VALGGFIGAATRRVALEERAQSDDRRRGDARSALSHSPSQPSACPEIDCLRTLLPLPVLEAAEHRALSIGLGADRVLIYANAISEEAYLNALATSLGASYWPLDQVAREDCPLDDAKLIQASTTGLLPLHRDGRTVWIIAPHGLIARHLAVARRQAADQIEPYGLTSSEQLCQFIARYTPRSLGRRAANGLSRTQPLMSNAPRPRIWKSIMTAFLIVGLLGLPLFWPAAINTLGMLLCAVFLAAAALRLWSALCPHPIPRRLTRIGDDKLPIYTIICALYREASVVEDLVTSIRALDYPIEKLDVKFVLEPDDHETTRALDRLNLGPPFEIIMAPRIGPRTKPKALNVGLALARGVYTVVFDAEDAPEPDQLRRAAAAFMAADDGLACLQASLTIDNTADNWLARMFTANYAGQFDVLLPGLAALRLPFPLGGSSNHFRTSVLHATGGWDPHNVTEDADLGIRLHRLGYRAAVLPSATYEEAPTRFVPWLKQRTRWYKGWMQTWRVHTRRPLQLIRELGLAGTVVFQLFLACNVLSALVHPIFMAMLGYYLFAQPPMRATTAIGAVAPLFIASLVAGYASTIALDFIGLQRRGLLAHAWVLVLTPLHWLLLSLAAWRAVYQLLSAPQRWEKTEHGLAKNSRRDDLTRRRRGRRSIDWETLTHPAATAIMATGADLLATPGGERGRPSRRRPQK